MRFLITDIPVDGSTEFTVDVVDTGGLGTANQIRLLLSRQRMITNRC